jgi:hypothetical protein
VPSGTQGLQTPEPHLEGWKMGEEFVRHPGLNPLNVGGKKGRRKALHAAWLDRAAHSYLGYMSARLINVLPTRVS